MNKILKNIVAKKINKLPKKKVNWENFMKQYTVDDQKFLYELEIANNNLQDIKIKQKKKIKPNKK